MLYTLHTLFSFTETHEGKNLDLVFSIDVTDQICKLISTGKTPEIRALAFEYCGNMTLGDQKIIGVSSVYAHHCLTRILVPT